jgi:hypothetical protein
MKMGTTASLYRYDPAACCAIQLANLRSAAIPRYASAGEAVPLRFD